MYSTIDRYITPSLRLYLDFFLSLRLAQTAVRVGNADSDSWENKERLLVSRSQTNYESKWGT